MYLDRQRELWIYFLLFCTYFILLPRGGHDFDASCWASWSIQNYQHGLGNAYSGWTDYLPLYQYVLYIYGNIQGNDDLVWRNLYQLKLFTLLFDIIGVGAVVYFLRNVYNRPADRVFIVLCFFLNVGFFYNTVIWGQVDGILTTLVFLSILFALRNKVALSIVSYCLAINMKLQAIIFLPLLLVVLYPLIYEKHIIKKIGVALLVSGLVQSLILLPFYMAGNLGKMWEVVLGSFGKYPVVSMNAFNMWHWFLKGDLMHTSNELVWAGLTYKQWGILLFFFISFWAFLPMLRLVFNNIWYKITIDKAIFTKYVLLLGSLIPIMFFFVNTEMHERYAQPAILFIGAYAFLYQRFAPFVLFSLANFLNHAAAQPNPNMDMSLFIFNPDVIAALFFACMLLLFLDMYNVSWFKRYVSTYDWVHKKMTKVMAMVVLLILMYFPFFAYLDTLPIQIWDEARLATNAREMFLHANWLVPHFEGAPDMWNTKPPLMIWLQVLFMKVIGINELSVRLPAAISAFITAIIVLLVWVRQEKNFWLGVLSVCFLMTSAGFIGIHSARTGDYDALLTLFSTIACFSLYLFLDNKKVVYLYVLFSALALGILTKGITIMLFGPGMLLYVFWKKQFLSIIKNKHFYIGLLGLIIVVLAYYIMREQANNGYLQAVMENELGGRFLNTLENHQGNFWYYLRGFVVNNRFQWIWLCLMGMVLYLSKVQAKYKDFFGFTLILGVSYFIVISLSKTKLIWYDMPLYPLMSVQAAISIYYVYYWLKEKGCFSNEASYFRVYAFVIIVLLGLFYVRIVESVYRPKEIVGTEHESEMGYILKKTLRGEFNFDGAYICNGVYAPQVAFYTNLLRQQQQDIGYKYKQELQVGDKVLSNKDDIKQYIVDNFKCQTTDLGHNVTLNELIEKK
jgi:4-amino-4-deoxy-L-arabinose transferase-like glycosyltransferase/Gpi18-like mannosyltransferase